MADKSPPSGHSQTLLANGNTSWVDVVGPVWVSLSNNFGSGTAKIQRKDSGGNAVDLAGESYTAATERVIDFPLGAYNQVRVNLASSTSPDLDVVIQGSSEHQKVFP